MKKHSRLGLIASAALLTGCASHMPVGTLYTELDLPIHATANSTATKTGTSVAHSYLGLVATGDASIETAKKAGGITKVTHVDWKAKNFLGIYGTYTTTVHGE
jgi:hypothetical protein